MSYPNRSVRPLVSLSTILVGAGLCLALVGCDSDVSVDDSDGGAGGSGGSGASGGSGGDGGAGASGGSGGTCDAFDDEVPPAEVTVTIKNETGQPIYLPSTCGEINWGVASQDNPNTGYGNYGTDCGQSCEDIIASGFEECPLGAACESTAYMLAPDATVEFTWIGRRYSDSEVLPAECVDSPLEQSCRRILAAEAGDYAFSVTAYDSCTDCDCDVGDPTNCVGEANGMQGQNDGASFSYPSDTEVEVTFGVCAFGCAEAANQ